MTDALLEIHTAVLGGMTRGPKPFAKRADTEAEDFPCANLADDAFSQRLTDESDALTVLWERKLTSWDFEERAAWATAAPRTDERRAEIYGHLGFEDGVRKALTNAVVVSKKPGHTTITAEFTPWYTRERAEARAFYWPAYEKRLRAKGWSSEAIAGLDEASRAVVERLTDPEQVFRRQARGLVVGYVQSGKTANFTGVTAKAIDSGYRLVIILGGTLNLLRKQTQRRLDMELIGQENILRGADPEDLDSLVGIDYIGDDEEWPQFVSHGGRPSALSAFDIERLTTRDRDYQSLLQGIRGIEFEKRERGLPLYDPRNLHHADARVMVVKKNRSVLDKLIKDLKQIQGLLGELPALIIDDESDQASVNTTDPKKWESDRPKRTAINSRIAQLLTLLPRSQYVGYTATPFANVFIDPSDSEDIFPRDFLISLPRPEGYMGVQDFHDLDSLIPYDERTYANSRAKSHVRGIYSPDEIDDKSMQEAMDSFVLTGAMKLYRAAHGVPDGPYRHHTMLVHESVRKDDHAELALRLNTMWHQAGYVTNSTGHDRLADLFQRDIRPVSQARAADLPAPASYDELRPYISQACSRIRRGGNPVVIVNGDSDKYFDQLDLDFDRQPHVWKILVGGTKLSRGFTVEGLTVTYYRRTTQQADTLMQMGRWFGFRPGYQDLVRLYISRAEKLTKASKSTVDLYEAFEAICLDEETFRDQLAQYAELVEGKPLVTPQEIPPLVSQHLPWLKPSSRTKMYNAQVEEIAGPGQIIEPTAHPLSHVDLAHNTEQWLPLLERLSATPDIFTTHDEAYGKDYHLTALTASVSHAQLMEVLEKLRWWNAAPFLPHLRFLREIAKSSHLIDDWLLITPHYATGRGVSASVRGSVPLALSKRERRRVQIFGYISDRKHRATARRIARATPPTSDPVTERFSRDRRGAILLYPVIEDDPSTVVRNGEVDPGKVAMVFSLVAPASTAAAGRPPISFSAIDKSRSDSPIIDTSG
ncbi:Z1 domain-containing protein [Streptomyces sp. NBC_01617]|uniref:Z1 domain-containing protein n=1 Tax=Streptomyces sp. NBC_01617 TaxID=2975899 RepID=UPI00386DBDB7|nr:Z1 domain-containing protein [Streptomyces sp. NBC_01617]